jgi:hypothetical protein
MLKTAAKHFSPNSNTLAVFSIEYDVNGYDEIC